LTTSIDVYVDDVAVLRTGGKLKSVGSVSEAFEHGGRSHVAELSWGVAMLYAFPVALKIDGQLVSEGWVRPGNWWMSIVVAVFPFAVLALLRVLIAR
jgi:hypothetical protein